MTAKTTIALAALAAGGLLGARGLGAPGSGAAPAAPARVAAAAATGPDLAQLLPGVPVDDLTPSQREVLAKVAQDEICYCGCPHTLSGCLREHPGCLHAPRMAALAARLARGGLTHLQVLKVLTEYYASFDRAKRAALDVKGFGPPLGNPNAPVSIVEFSDFTCPHCQALRPKLEEFISARKDRLKLYYKPFPLAGHPRAFEAALAVEWARDKGLFWQMHDALFDRPHDLDDDALAATAGRLGGDPADLRQALGTSRNRARILASQGEARRAGLTGTPALYFDGRRYTLSDHSEASLQFTLEDEEEWRKGGGWARD